MIHRSKSIIFLLAAGLLGVTTGFISPLPQSPLLVPGSRRFFDVRTAVVSWSTTTKVHPEYIVGEEDDEEGVAKGPSAERRPAIRVDLSKIEELDVVHEPEVRDDRHQQQQQWQPRLQYAALVPGAVVQVQVGDLSLARKAWKKRRRTGSPLLVPCSVLNVDRASTVRWNLVYLLEKFGQPVSGGGGRGGIHIPLTALNQRYRSHLKGSLHQHAVALGFDAISDLVQYLFHPQAQETHRVTLVVDEDPSKDENIWLRTDTSRFKAQKRAARAVVVQVQDNFNINEEDDDEDSHLTLQHTGLVRSKRSNPGPDESFYRLGSLSAALRVSQKDDVDSGHIQDGSFHPAAVFDYDPTGDAGTPLLTLVLNPSSAQAMASRDRKGAKERQQQLLTRIQNPKVLLSDLQAGDGPLEGKVVRLIKGGALVDCQVARPADGGVEGTDYIQVLGFLPFKDAIVEEQTPIKPTARETRGPRKNDEQEWDGIRSLDDLVNMSIHDEDDVEDGEEEEGEDGSTLLQELVEGMHISEFDLDDDDGSVSEDITHLFEMGEDGSLVYKDPETGETLVLDLDDDDEHDEEGEEGTDDDEGPVNENGLNNNGFEFDIRIGDDDDLESDNSPMAQEIDARFASMIAEKRTKGKPIRLHVGDVLDVYLKSVSEKSRQYRLTMSSAVSGKRPKEIKRAGEVDKKLDRLEAQLGGLDRVDELCGKEMNGVVKATSKTGDWLYVKPTSENLPVGVATLTVGDSKEYIQGDPVRIRFEGIDEQRGQLSLTVLP